MMGNLESVQVAMSLDEQETYLYQRLLAWCTGSLEEWMLLGLSMTTCTEASLSSVQVVLMSWSYLTCL